MKSASQEKCLRILVSRNSSGAIGGAELSAADQAVVLDSLGHKVFFTSNLKTLRAKLPKSVKSYAWSSIESPKILRSIRILYLMPLGFIRAVYLTLKIKPDVINPHSREDQIAFTLTKFIHKKPVVWKNAGDLRYQILPQRSSLLARFTQRLLKAALRRADKVFSLSSADNGYLFKAVSGLDEQRFLAIPSGILFANYNKNNPLKHKSSRLIIGTIIRLHKDKGVQDLIKSFIDLHKNHPATELWIVGDGDYRAQLEQLAKNEDCIKFFGQQENVSKYYTAMDIFVQPAHQEPWGRNVVEAMYFGKTFVGSNIGGIAEQIEDGRTGLLFKTGDVNDLAAKLEMLVSSTALRKRLGVAAQQEIAKNGDFRNIVELRILPVYLQAAHKVKLTVDATPFVRDRIDGIGRYSRSILGYLANNYDIELTGFIGDKLSDEHKGKCTLSRLPIPRKIYSFLYKKNLVPEIGPGGESMLCFNFVEFPKTRRKVTLFVHDLAFISHPETLTPKNLEYLKKYVPRSLARAEKVVTISKTTKQKIIETYGISPSKISIVPPGIDSGLFKPAKPTEITRVREKYKLPKKYILFFGTLEPRKNIVGCIEAYLKLPGGLRKDYALVLAGSRGWRSEEVENRIKLLQQDGENIFVPGYIVDQDVPVIYSAASVFLFPSLDEGFGIPIIEAMACGTPVVTSDIEVLRETAGDAALFVKPRNFQDISNQLNLVLGSKMIKQEKVKAGLNRAQKYSWKKSVEALVANLNK
jgi:glycosyltransferase involved in cell wall biosynthesis